MRVTIPKGIVGDFAFTVLKRNLSGTRGQDVFASAKRKAQKVG